MEIILDDNFLNDTKVVKKYCDELELKTITEMLREEFDDYDIKSVVKSKGDLKGIITFERGPCAIYYPLVWRLTLRKSNPKNKTGNYACKHSCFFNRI